MDTRHQQQQILYLSKGNQKKHGTTHSNASKHQQVIYNHSNSGATSSTSLYMKHAHNIQAAETKQKVGGGHRPASPKMTTTKMKAMNCSDHKTQKSLSSNKSYTKFRKDSISLQNETILSCGGGGNVASNSSHYKPPHQFVLSTATMGGEPIAQPSQYADDVYVAMLHDFSQPQFSSQGGRQSSSLGWKGSIAKEGTPCGNGSSSTRLMKQDKESPGRHPSWTNLSTKPGKHTQLKQSSPDSVLSQGAKINRTGRIKAATTTLQGVKSPRNNGATYLASQKSSRHNFLERTNQLTSNMSTALIKRQSATLSQTQLLKNLSKVVSLRTLGQQPVTTDRRISPQQHLVKKKSPPKQFPSKGSLNAAGTPAGKVIQKPRNPTIIGQQTSTMQRHMSNKILSPQATNSRQNTLKVHGVVSSPVNQKTSTVTSTTAKKIMLGEPLRPKTHLKTKEKQQRHTRVENSTEITRALPLMQDNLQSNSRQALQSYKHSGLSKGPGAHHQSLQRLGGTLKSSGTLQPNASTASLLIKAPSQLAFHSHQQTMFSEKQPVKLGLADRPKTTMLVQLQQNLSKQLSKKRTQKSPSEQHPQKQLMMTQSEESLNRNTTSSRIGHTSSQPQRTSGDFTTLQSYRQTTQSSQGLLQTVRSSQGLNMYTKTSAEQVSKRGPLTQPRRSTTTTKIASTTVAVATRQNKKGLGNKSHSLAVGPGVVSARKSSTKKGCMTRVKIHEEYPQAADDDRFSNKSCGTHIIDEVLHQQKTEAYRDLQRKCETVLGQYSSSNVPTLFQPQQQVEQTVIAASDMGRIIELENDDADVSLDKAGDVAQELDTSAGVEHENYPCCSYQQMTAQEPQVAPVPVASQKSPLTCDQQHSTPTPRKAAYKVAAARNANSRAKTSVHLVQDPRVIQDGGDLERMSQFSHRKKSNDTVMALHANDQKNKDNSIKKRKSSLVALLNASSKNNTVCTRGVRGQHTQNARRELDASESLINSYMTGSGSVAGGIGRAQQQRVPRNMQSSQSANSVLGKTSCSLGPKSEMRQPEQVNAEHPIKILVQKKDSPRNKKKSKQINQTRSPDTNRGNSTHTNDKSKVIERQQSTDQQGLNLPQLHTVEKNSKSGGRVIGPKQSTGKTTTMNKPGQNMKVNNLIPAFGQESFKSTNVDFTESMNENQITKMTIAQSRELILKACQNGDLRNIRRIPVRKPLKGYDLVNFQAQNDPRGMTPLHLACQGGHVEIVELLIRRLGANVDLQNSLGETALHIACREGHKSCIERLLLARAQTTIPDKMQGNTPLHVLAQTNHQRNQQATTVGSDAIKLTMNSPASKSQKHEPQPEPSLETNPSDMRLDSSDFTCNSPKERTGNARYSLIDLILPFAEESKSIANQNGVLPWELAGDSEVAKLLKPRMQQVIGGIVTASQIQGQSTNTNHHSPNGVRIRSPVTRNHGMKTIKEKNVLEVKQVSEGDVAKIFTSYNPKSNKTLDKLLEQQQQQHTFEDQIASRSPADAYLTNSSKESTMRDRKRMKQAKHEVSKHQDFLDEDIQNIDKLIERDSADPYCHNEYKDMHVAKEETKQLPESQPYMHAASTNITKKHKDTPMLSPSVLKESCSELELQILTQHQSKQLSMQKPPRQTTQKKPSVELFKPVSQIHSKKVTIKLNKVKTTPILFNSSSTQNKSASKIRLTDPVKPSATMALKAPFSNRLGPPGTKTSLTPSAMQKSPLTVTDLKQKVDKQALNLLEAMQRGSQQTGPGQEIAQRIGPEQFVAHQLLGNGSFGEVFLVERRQDRKLLAMKVLSKRKIKQQNLKKYAITERNVMCSMGDHPFIVQLRYAFQTREHLFLISDYCPGGDLSQYLEIEGSFEESKTRLYISEILLGIEALHKQNIIFRDLKPDNVIIDKSGHAMLTDFGLSRENVRRSEIGAKSFCGSYAYLAPEMLKKNGHGKAVDWYLLGVIMFEMVTGLPPYYADDKDQLFKNIKNDTIDMGQVQAETSVSPECIDLMQRLLEKDPVRRLGTKMGGFEIRQHPFFRDTDWEVVFSRQLTMPEPYLANMAMDIIKAQPYLVAGHPHTVGDVCPRDHRSYLQGWSFTEAVVVGTESMLSSSEKLQLEDDVAMPDNKNSMK